MFDELREKLAAYLEAKSLFDEKEQATKTIEREEIERPVSVQSEEEWATFQLATANRGERLKAAEEEQRTAWRARAEAYKALLNAIPAKNVWFKVVVDAQAYGVGYYTDVWGGTHYEVDVREWSDALAEKRLSDRTYYP